MVRGTAEAVTPSAVGMTVNGGGLMLGNAQMTGATAPDSVVVTWKLEKLITEVVTAGIMIVVVTVIAVKTVLTRPPMVTVVDQPTSGDVEKGRKLMVVGSANVVGGKTNMQGGGHTAVWPIQTAGSRVTTVLPSLPGPPLPVVELPQTGGQYP